MPPPENADKSSALGSKEATDSVQDLGLCSWNDEDLDYDEISVLSRGPKGLGSAFFVRDIIDRYTRKKSTTFELIADHLQDTMFELDVNRNMRLIEDDTSTIGYKDIYHLRDPLKMLRDKAEAEQQVARHDILDTFIRCLDDMFAPLDKRVAALLEENRIEYELLWTLFAPKTIAFTTCRITKAPCATRVSRYSNTINRMGQKNFRIEGHTFSGKGEQLCFLDIPVFESTKRIDSLSVYPLCYHPQVTAMRERLVENGRRVMAWTGIHHLQHSGWALPLYHNGNQRAQVLEGRIVVNRVTLDNEPSPSISISCGDEELSICSPTLTGFALTSLKRYVVAVDNLREVLWMDRPLAMPGRNGQLVLDLVNCHYRQKENPPPEGSSQPQEQNTTILLRGPPSVGKTMTAVSIAERCKRPLLILDAGSIDANLAVAESLHNEVFANAALWNAILVIKNADILLRTSSIVSQRNTVIGRLVQRLQTFDGVCIFVENQSEVQSRAEPAPPVNCTLDFLPLSSESRKEVSFFRLDQVTPSQSRSNKEALAEALAGTPLNSHQILKVVQTASYLGSDAGNITTQDLDRAIELQSGVLNSPHTPSASSV
ncbi:P-loop containing protein [Fusarium heterosporum]|uniref:P-loop containing protein n=1 Tax=Fusarium heterosporum TaxID=42747 RepID=A0A8H5T6V1_FUSHE|nr:P-loop containing protein [Fusarium heterosporum]